LRNGSQAILSCFQLLPAIRITPSAEIQTGSVRQSETKMSVRTCSFNRFGHGRDNRVIVQRQISVFAIFHPLPSVSASEERSVRRGIIDGKADLLCIYLGVCMFVLYGTSVQPLPAVP
jgi:hypothetical protein